MHTIFLLPLLTLAAGQIQFQRHDIAEYRAVYQIAVADVNGDGRQDVLALSTEANRVDWFENPSWVQHPISTTARNIDLAPRDMDGDGLPELALASGFYFAEGDRGGQIQWLQRRAGLDEAWLVRPIAVDPVVHRLRWADLDGDGRAELVHAPIFGPGSAGPAAVRPSHLWAFRVPADPQTDPWQPWTIDQSLTVLHGMLIADLDADGRDEILTASFEGICRFDYERDGVDGKWHRRLIAPGGPPTSSEPGAARGTSEVMQVAGWTEPPALAAIEPWHGHQVVLYQPAPDSDLIQRRVLDEGLSEGHALVAADLDGDGRDEIVAGWRAAGGGLAAYRLADRDKTSVERIELDRDVAVESAMAVDLNGDGKLDLVIGAGATTKSPGTRT